VDAHVHTIVAILRRQSGFNFEPYKHGTLTRRVERRMGLRQLERVEDYLALLASDAGECDALASDLLVRVTQFFRDPEAWDELREVALKPLVEAALPESAIRLWVAGCATGQEAYSLAMMLLELIDPSTKPLKIQMFATDIGGQAATLGRDGVYASSIADEVGPERLQRFFVRLADGRYQVNKLLRECVVFSEQDLLSDPPFSRMDLVVCRNVLIYLDPEVQQRTIALFHFGLVPGGYLFLGPAETVGKHEDLFASLNKRWRIFQRIGPRRTPRPHIELSTSQMRVNDVSLAGAQSREGTFARIAQQLLLERFAPAAVLISTDYDILYYCGPTQRFLAQSAGVPTHNLMELALEPLRRKIRGAVHRALERREPTTVYGVGVGDDARRVRLTVSPVTAPRSLGATTLLVVFEELANTEPEVVRVGELDLDDTVIAQLEHELGIARQDLSLSIEQLEASNEELKAVNEEVTSMNEELQSTNEELETSKEELQSLNEELTTVNLQLQAKVEELEDATDDLRNLLVSTHVATLFLDTELRIRRFTPAVTELMRLNRSDIGRVVSDLSHAFTVDDLPTTAQQVLDQLVPIESEVHTANGRWYLRRIQPYRTESQHVAGVVVTFSDFTSLKHVGAALAKSQERFRQVAELGLLGIAFFDPRDGTVTDANEAFLALLDRSSDEVARRRVSIDDVVPGPLRGSVKEALASAEPTPLVPTEVSVRRPDGTELHMLFGVTLFRDSGEGALFFLDISARKQAEHDMHALTETLERRVDERSALVRLLSDVAIIANETSDAPSGFRKALARICVEIGYHVGHVWLPRRALDGGFADGEMWWADDHWPNVELMTEHLRERVLEQHVGLVGSAARARRPRWTREVETDVGWLDRRALMRWPVRSVLAIPMCVGERVLGVIELMSSGTTPPTDEHFEVLTRVAAQLACALERDVARRAVRHLTAELTQVEERQRAEMADTLHDAVGQTLTAARLRLAALRPDVDMASQEAIDTVTQYVGEALDATRVVTTDLMPPPLRDLELVAGFRWLGNDAARRFGLTVEVVTGPELDGLGRLDGRVAAPLFRGIRELLHNIAKHAEVPSAELRVARVSDQIVVEVQDAGAGFDASPNEVTTHGLASLRERMAWLGGDVLIESVRGEGTCVTVRVPWIADAGPAAR